MTQTSVTQPNAIVAAIAEQVACYEQLARLTGRQNLLVRQGQTEELLHLLGMRQSLLEEIGRLEVTIGPARKTWPQYVVTLEASERKHAEGLLARARQLLEEITTADRNDAMVLQARKLNLGKQINAATVARKMNQNYAVAAYGRRESKVDIVSK